MPSTMIDSVSVPESTLTSAGEWTTINFSGHSGLNPTQGLCVSMECETSSPAAWFYYRNSGDTDPNSGLIRGSQTGGWTSYEPDKALAFKVHGIYTPRPPAIVPGSWKRTADTP